jgi:hypothetical protein
MENIPEYFEKDCEVLKAVFPSGISKDDLEILIFLLNSHFAQRSLARLISDCLGENYYDVYNLVLGVDRRLTQLDPYKMEEIRTALIANGYKNDAGELPWANWASNPIRQELTLLRKEYEGTSDSFIFKLRGEFIWDREIFSKLIRAMRIDCEEMIFQDSIEKWMANVYWQMHVFVKNQTMQPEFPKPYPEDYYQKAFTLIDELSTWLFTGYSFVSDTEEHFMI